MGGETLGVGPNLIVQDALAARAANSNALSRGFENVTPSARLRFLLAVFPDAASSDASGVKPADAGIVDVPVTVMVAYAVVVDDDMTVLEAVDVSNRVVVDVKVSVTCVKVVVSVVVEKAVDVEVLVEGMIVCTGVVVTRAVAGKLIVIACVAVGTLLTLLVP